jgi:hypothetical protein
VVRFVTHRDVSAARLDEAIERIRRVAGDLTPCPPLPSPAHTPAGRGGT